jgi:hypothetical protein
MQHTLRNISESNRETRGERLELQMQETKQYEGQDWTEPAQDTFHY